MIKPYYQFLNEPVSCKKELYRVTLEKCVQIFSDYPGLQAIYQYGGISTPGISDIDLLLIFNQKGKVVKKNWKAELTSQQKYLFLHNPAVISPRLFADSAYITHLEGLRLLWGSHLPVKNPDEETIRFLTYFTVLEHTIRLVVTTTRQNHIRLIKQRPLLCELNSIRYDLKLLGLNSEWETDFVGPIEQLRQDWFHLPVQERREELLRLFCLSSQVLKAILHRLAEYAMHWNINTYPTGSYPSRWAGVYLLSNLDGSRVSGLAKLVPVLPFFREKFLRFFRLEIGLSPILLSLLQTDSFPAPYEEVYAKRKEILKEYADFYGEFDGYWGSLHVAPFSQYQS